MEQVIYKYELSAHYTEIKIPGKGVVLTAQMQNSKPYVWVMIELDQPEEEHCFIAIGTGNQYELNDDWMYVDTIQDPPYVWHIFHRKKDG